MRILSLLGLVLLVYASCAPSNYILKSDLTVYTNYELTDSLIVGSGSLIGTERNAWKTRRPKNYGIIQVVDTTLYNDFHRYGVPDSIGRHWQSAIYSPVYFLSISEYMGFRKKHEYMGTYYLNKPKRKR